MHTSNKGLSAVKKIDLHGGKAIAVDLLTFPIWLKGFPQYQQPPYPLSEYSRLPV